MDKRIIGLLGIVTLVAIVPATVWHDHNEDRWAKWIYDYQPLIVGAFAIFAAYLTVNTMRETDDKQESRHRELMRLNLRRDKLIARRAAYPQVLDLQDCCNDLQELLMEMQCSTYEEFLKAESRRGDKKLLTTVVVKIEDVVTREQLHEVKPLLDYDGFRALQIILKEIEPLKRLAVGFANHVFDLDSSRYVVGRYDARLQNTISKLMRVKGQIGILNESIVSLAEEFDQIHEDKL